MVFPVVWQHINLLGNFEFRQTGNIISIQYVADSFGEKNLSAKLTVPLLYKGCSPS